MKIPSGAAVPGEGVIKGIALECGFSVREVKRIIDIAKTSTPLPVAAICTRILWLFSKTDPDGMKMGEAFGIKDIDTMAAWVADPCEPVFRLIREKTGFSRDYLLKIFDSIRYSPTTDRIRMLSDFSRERTLQELKWGLVDLHFPEYYFKVTPPEEIGNQIRINRLYEMYGAGSKDKSYLKISYNSASGDMIHWAHPSRTREVESEIEEECRAKSSLANISVYSPSPDLSLYISSFAATTNAAGSSFDDAASLAFYRVADAKAVTRYRKLWARIQETEAPCREASFSKETSEHRLMIGYPTAVVPEFLSQLTTILADRGVRIARKYCHCFGGALPTAIVSLYAKEKFPEDIMAILLDMALTRDPNFARLADDATLTREEALFAECASEFVHQFITSEDPNISYLEKIFGGDPEHREAFAGLKKRVSKDDFRSALISATISARPELVKTLFAIFAGKFSPQKGAGRQSPPMEDFENELGMATANPVEIKIFRTARVFIDATIRTNFYLPAKKAVSFRLDPAKLAGNMPADIPFGIFFVKGNGFFGFHVRFKDIARGGIRIVRSSSLDDYGKNADNAFEECYNLAFTQNKKNKDIPEGGSKGIIVLDYRLRRSPDPAASFKSYVDSILDLLLPKNAPLIRNFNPEILFFGPDEGTGDFMDWACRYARVKGYATWKSITTGKGAELGGISHIDFGMTTASVHQFVLGILGKLGIKEKDITKAQTGGPDGDLGGNEIIVSQDKTIVVVDKGGVIYDPNGLDRKELLRLAKARIDSANFDPAKLSAKGFVVRTSDRNLPLPDGTIVHSGMIFRNNIHLDSRIAADLFLPCGGRPKSVNISNYQALLDKDGKPIFKWIVEGANLFITQDARVKLEEHGAILFKDSSTNKGGVTSSSLEVLAALAMSDQEYAKLMTPDAKGKIPPFRKQYIQEIIAIIKRNAQREFEILWETHRNTGIPLTRLSDSLSEGIVKIAALVEESDLFSVPGIRRKMIEQHTPPSLLKLLGMDTILKRVPLNYQKAIFAKTLASGFIYANGDSFTPEDYRLYIDRLGGGSAS
jgi:glutamate dehydrogenase